MEVSGSAWILDMSSPNTTLGLEYPPSRALSLASLVFWDLGHPDKTVIISATVERFLRAPENGNVNDDETYFVLSLRGNPSGSFRILDPAWRPSIQTASTGNLIYGMEEEEAMVSYCSRKMVLHCSLALVMS